MNLYMNKREYYVMAQKQHFISFIQSPEILFKAQVRKQARKTNI